MKTASNADAYLAQTINIKKQKNKKKTIKQKKPHNDSPNNDEIFYNYYRMTDNEL